MNVAAMKKADRKKQYAKAGKAYQQVIKNAEKTGNIASIDDTKRQFMIAYSEVINAYRNDIEIGNKDISSEFRKLVLDSQNYLSYSRGEVSVSQNQDATMATFSSSLGTGLRGIEETPGARKAAAEEDISGQRITANQKSGLLDIAGWLLRNMDKTTKMGESKSAWVRGYMLRQPPRVKLLTYYMVENGAMSLEGDALKAAIVKSQSPDYVPNLARFKSKMIASRALVHKRVFGGKFQWETLAQSARFSASMAGQLARFGIEPSEVQNANASSTSGNGPGIVLPSDLMTHLVDLNKIREDLETLIHEREAAGNGWTRSNNAQLQIKLKAFWREATQLIQQVQILGDFGVGAEGGKISAAGDVQGTIDEGGGYLADSLETLHGLMNERFDQIGDASSYIAVIAAVNAAATAVTNLVELFTKRNYTTGEEKLEKSVELISNLWKVTRACVTVYEKAKNVENVMGPATADLVSGILDFGEGGVQVFSAGVQKSRLTSSQKKIQENQSLTEKDKRLTDQAARLRRRQLNTKQKVGGMKMATGAIEIAAGILTATGVGAPVAAALKLVALGMTIFQSVYAYYQKKSNIKQTIDDYLLMDQNILPIVAGGLTRLAEYQNTVMGRPVPLPSPDQLRDQVRLECAAMMGFYGLNEFYNYITGVYAELIYSKAMLTEDGNPIPVDENGKPQVLTETNKQYIEMLGAYGLKPDFKNRRPTAATIQKKMAG